MEVEATDRIEVSIQPGDTDKVIDLQPGENSAMHLLVIKSSSYGAHLSFKVGDGTTDSPSLTLDSPQIFSGGGIALFGVAPRQIKFTNTGSDKPAVVEVLAARDATP
jgi:hypothetical protein